MKNKVVVITLPTKNKVIFFAFLFLAVVIPVCAIIANANPFGLHGWEFRATLVGVYLFLFCFSVYLLIQLRNLKEIVKILRIQIEEQTRDSNSN